MFLKAGENESITGTIFDRANNFNVKGSIEKGKFIGQAKDTLLNSLFEVEGYHHKDTLVFLLSMVRPQISPPLPVKFQKYLLVVVPMLLHRVKSKKIRQSLKKL